MSFRSSLILRITIVPVLFVLPGCGVRELPAPSAPAKEVPADIDVPTDEPAPGTGRVVIDTNGKQAMVTEILGAATAYAGNHQAIIVSSRPVCTTPCVVDLPYGTHPLVLASTQSATDHRESTVDLEVGPRVKIFRHELGEKKPASAIGTAGSVLVTLGTIAATTGAIMWGVAAAAHDDGRPSSLEEIGQISTGAGLGAVILGIPMMILGPPSRRPGATTEWVLPGGAPPSVGPSPPASVGGARL